MAAVGDARKRLTESSPVADVDALVDIVLRTRRPALFEGDWRSKASGAQTTKWIAALEAEARELAAAILASDWLAAQIRADQ